MLKTIKEKIFSRISFITKTARIVSTTEKYCKDLKFMLYDIKPTKRKPIPKSVREEVFKRDNYCCVKCGSTKNLEVDHDDSLANGGTDHIDNLQTLCRDCNRRKGVN